MLICDINELGDKRLNPEESVIKLREENNAMVANRRIDGQDELEDVERSFGARMDWRELIRRLSKCNYQLLFKEGSPGNIAVYAPKNRKDREGFEPDPTRPDWHNDHKYVGGFQKEPLPEYGYIIADERGLPKREVRGWRSVLLSMLKGEAISYEQTIKQFGIATGKRSTRWFEQTRSYRTHGQRQ